MLYAKLNDLKHGPFKDLKELRSKMFYEGEKGDTLTVVDEDSNTVAVWKKAWIRMDEGVAWHDKATVDKRKGGV